MNSGRSEKKLDKYTAFADRILFLKDSISKENLKILLYQYWYMFLEDYFYFYEKNRMSIYLKRMKKSLYKVFPIFIRNKFFTLKDATSVIIFLFNPMLYKKLFYEKREKI